MRPDDPLDRFRELILDFAANVGCDTVPSLDLEGHTHILRFDGRQDVVVRFIAETGTVAFCAPLEDQAVGNDNRWRKLLQLNDAHRQNEALGYGLEPENGRLLVFAEYPALGLDIEKFESCLMRLVDAAHAAGLHGGGVREAQGPPNLTQSLDWIRA